MGSNCQAGKALDEVPCILMDTPMEVIRASLTHIDERPNLCWRL